MSNYAFIGGSGRSGTTILKQILRRHPQVATSDEEWRFTIDADGLLDFYLSVTAGWTPQYYDARLRRLRALLRLTGRKASPWTEAVKLLVQRLGWESRLAWKTREAYATSHLAAECPRWDELTSALLRDLTAFRYPGWWKGTPFGARKCMAFTPAPQPEQLAQRLGTFYRDVADGCMRQRNAAFHVDDHPQMFLWFHKWLRLVPEARMVHIYRDPRDVVASYATKRWAPADPVLSARVLCATMEHWFRVKQDIPAASLLEVRMETLMEDTEATLRGIAGFLGIPWHEAMLEVDLRHAHSGRWRQEFTHVQKREVQSTLAGVMKAMGYEEEPA